MSWEHQKKAKTFLGYFLLNHQLLVQFAPLLPGTGEAPGESEAASSLLQPASLRLPWGSGGNTPPALPDTDFAPLSSPLGTFPQPAPSSVAVSLPFIYGVKSFLNMFCFGLLFLLLLFL